MTLARITEIVSESGGPDQLRFTAALANGRDLYAFRYAHNDEPNTLYYSASSESVVIVSEPLDKDHSNWTPVPPNSVIAARAGQPVEVRAALRFSQLEFGTGNGKIRPKS